MKKIYFILFALFSVFAFSQTLGSRLEKKTLALGEVGLFRINISDLQGKDVISAPKNELLPFHFEEIKDSINKRPEFYERVIEFAIFEEGKYTIPALDFNIGGELFHTIPYEVEVINTAQKGDVINDIMKNKEVKLEVKDYWELYKWYILGVLILLALIFIIYYLIFSIYYFLTMLGMLSMGFIVPSVMRSTEPSLLVTALVGVTGLMVPSALNSMRSMQTSR